jgi:hypothetical protein
VEYQTTFQTFDVAIVDRGRVLGFIDTVDMVSLYSTKCLVTFSRIDMYDLKLV